MDILCSPVQSEPGKGKWIQSFFFREICRQRNGVWWTRGAPTCLCNNRNPPKNFQCSVFSSSVFLYFIGNHTHMKPEEWYILQYLVVKGEKIGLGLGQSKLIEDPHHYLIFLTPSWGRRSKQACFHFISLRWTCSLNVLSRQNTAQCAKLPFLLVSVYWLNAKRFTLLPIQGAMHFICNKMGYIVIAK